MRYHKHIRQNQIFENAEMMHDRDNEKRGSEMCMNQNGGGMKDCWSGLKGHIVA